MEIKEALNELKSNKISWYDFKENSTRLEIGEDIAKAMQTIKSGEKFDYLILENHLENLAVAKQYLKPDGTILLFVNNRFGLANFAGQDDFRAIYEENTKGVSKKQIENYLESQGFPNYKFFYLLPNQEATSVIFSDEYLPEVNHTKLIYSNLYEENSLLVFDEKKAMKQVTKAGEFKNFVNSYLVEINPKTQIKFVSFNNNRKKKYRLCTKMYADYVVKQATNEEAKNHIETMKQNIQNLKKYGFNILDKEENGTIISPYISGKNLYETLLEMIKNQQNDEVYRIIQKWFGEIQEKLQNERTEQINLEIFEKKEAILKNLRFVRNAYIDLVFENTFWKENQFTFFDQEWVIPNLPLEFILYRAVNNLYVYHPEIENRLPQKALLDRFQLTSFVPLFQKAERKLQNFIEDETMRKLYEQSEMYVKDVRQGFAELEKTLQKNGLLEAEEKKKEAYIEQLTIAKGDLEARVGLLEAEEKKKEQYIEKLTQENRQKSEVIQQLERIKQSQQKDIENLNEIIKVKDNQIEGYENMKSVKLAKKLRGKREK